MSWNNIWNNLLILNLFFYFPSFFLFFYFSSLFSFSSIFFSYSPRTKHSLRKSFFIFKFSNRILFQKQSRIVFRTILKNFSRYLEWWKGTPSSDKPISMSTTLRLKWLKCFWRRLWHGGLVENWMIYFFSLLKWC